MVVKFPSIATLVAYVRARLRIARGPAPAGHDDPAPAWEAGDVPPPSPNLSLFERELVADGPPSLPPSPPTSPPPPPSPLPQISSLRAPPAKKRKLLK